MALNLSKNDNSPSENGGNKKINLNLEKKEITSPYTITKESDGESAKSNKSNRGLIYIVIGLLVFGAGIFIYQYDSNSEEVAINTKSQIDSALASSNTAPQNEVKPDSNTASQVSTTEIMPTENAKVAENKNESEVLNSINQLIKTNNTQVANFDAGSEKISNSAVQSVEILIKYLTENTANKITVLGYASSDGDPGKNQILSENRAKKFKEYLISKGVNARQITTRGEGSSKPIADNSTIEGRQKNRRVEFILD